MNKTNKTKADSKDKSRKRVHMVQQTGDTLARHLDGRATDIQGTPQLMHEERLGSGS